MVNMEKSFQQYNVNGHINDRRLFPSLWHTRFRHLTELRENIKKVIAEEIAAEDKKVLADMGCGEMPYEVLLRPHLKILYAVDLPGNPKATNFIEPTTNRTSIQEASVDIVWSIMVLEHVSDPANYLAECKRILKPGGKLILCTHGHWMFHPDPIDHLRWTSQGLKAEVEKNGFTIVRFWGMMGLFSTSIQLLQDALLLHLPLTKYWCKPFAFVMQCFVSLATVLEKKSKTTREYINNDACVFFVVAKK